MDFISQIAFPPSLGTISEAIGFLVARDDMADARRVSPPMRAVGVRNSTR
jgi:hypothetical protein